MKYIIDIPDDTQKIIGFRQDYSLIYIDMTPYTEPDRSVIEDEVWDLVRIITDMTDVQRKECFGGETCNLDEYLTYQEAKAKYEAWRAERDEIRVGDEVKENTELWKGVIVGFDEFGDLVIMDRSGKSCGGYKAKYFKKTGRHFDEVEELLKKIGDET